MYPYAVVFGLSLYEIFLVTGLVAALFLGDSMGMKRGLSVALQKTLIFATIIAMLGGFFGAVFFQALYNYGATGIFTINSTTGMTFYGGLIVGAGLFLAVWFGLGKVLCKSDEPKKKFGVVADIAACVIPMAHGFGRLGCFFAGCCHGAKTDAWYGVRMHTRNGWQTVVPIQLFEALFLFALSAVLFFIFFRNLKKEKQFPLLPIYCVVYGIWRFFIEYARADERGETIISFLSPSQLIAVVLFITGIAYFCVWYFKIFKKDLEPIDEAKEDLEV